MKLIHPILAALPSRSPLLLALAILTPGTAFAQNLIDTSLFYNPDFKVRRNGANSGLLSLSTDNTPVSATNASGNVSWTHSAGGHAQVRTQLALAGIPLANLDSQLAAYTQTINDSLVFGREITSVAQLLNGGVNAGPALQQMENDVAGASIDYSWQSDATVSGLAIVPDQLYQVTFSVASGAGLPVNLLDSATFGITTPGVTGASNENADTLSLLGLFATGSGSSTGDFSFIFKSDQNRSALTFSFAASTGSGVSSLGGTDPNQNVLTFSDFQVVAIPEPGCLSMCGVLAGMITLRRKRTSAQL